MTSFLTCYTYCLLYSTYSSKYCRKLSGSTFSAHRVKREIQKKTAFGSGTPLLFRSLQIQLDFRRRNPKAPLGRPVDSQQNPNQEKSEKSPAKNDTGSLTIRGTKIARKEGDEKSRTRGHAYYATGKSGRA